MKPFILSAALFLTAIASGAEQTSTGTTQPTDKSAAADKSATSEPSAPHVVGGSTIGASVAVVQQLAYGWSVEKNILDKAVHNDQGQKVGKVEDVILSPERTLSYAIISTGGFLGMSKHDVAIPADQLKREGDKLVLAGATKDSLKAMPQFNYARDKKAE